MSETDGILRGDKHHAEASLRFFRSSLVSPQTIGALLLIILPFILYFQYLSNDAIFYPADSAQSYYPRFKTICDALQNENGFPFWQTIAFAGCPFHSNPENPTLYPPVLLLAAFFPPILAMNLTILIHLPLGMLGMYLLVLRLGKRMNIKPEGLMGGALMAAVIFGFNLCTRLEHFTLVTYGAAHDLIPWIFLTGDSLLNGASPRRSAGLLALLVSFQVFTGGLYVFPYTCLGLALWFVCLGLFGNRTARRRALTFGLLAGGIAVFIVMAKILPYITWIDTTNRADAFTPMEARGITLGGMYDRFSWNTVLISIRAFTGGGYYLPFVIFTLPLLRFGLLRMVFGLLLFGCFVAVGPLHTVLYEWVPPFDRIRYAARAWTLVNAFLPVAAGLGMHQLLAFIFAKFPKIRKRSFIDLCMGCAMAFVLLPFLWNTGNSPYVQMMNDPLSFRRVLERYPNWTEMARLAGKDWRAMCLDVRTADPSYRNEYFIAGALGVETVAGFLGHVWPSALERHAYPNDSKIPLPVRLRRLCILSVRYYVFSQDLKRRRTLPEESRTSVFPHGIDGERIGENKYARPRAFIPSAVGAVLGDQDGDVLYSILDAPSFRVDRVSLISYDRDDPPAEEELKVFDHIVVVDGDTPTAPSSTKVLSKAKLMGCRITRVKLPMNNKTINRLHEVAQELSDTTGKPVGQPAFERVSSREVQVNREDVSEGRFVTLSETWALYDGWEVRAGERRIPIRSADGVATSVYLRPNEPSFIARYEPPSVFWGFVLGALGLLGAFLLLLPGSAWTRLSRMILHDKNCYRA
jgi:hypothetical protein